MSKLPMAHEYRPDIDGLRAIAVIAVVLFHAGLSWFPGGYVGVDVFFVISGYLITGIVARELATGSFSLLRFYERRARRILPALFVMLLAVLAAGYLILLPGDYEKTAKSAASALLSVSNIYFFSQSGYFDDEAILKPLLHTWSLAVEEQFYLLLPLVLALVLARWRRWTTPIVCGLGAASLVAAILLTASSQKFAFYMLPTRAWELLAGSLLALGVVPRIAGARWRDALALAGLALIVAPAFLFDDDTAFPGPGAMLPVLGAMLVIHCAQGGWVGRVLGAAPLRAVGLISYSLYLWHWPIIVFAAYLSESALHGWNAAVPIAASIVIAALSWRFVEQPFRRRGARSALAIWRPALALGGAIGVAALLIARADGLPVRFDSDIARFEEARNISPRRDDCHNRLKDYCRLGSEDRPATVAVWGDSHGVELAYALGEVGARERFSLIQITRSVCPPTLDPVVDTARSCAAYNRTVLDYLLRDQKISTVVLAAYFEFDRYEADSGFGEGFFQAVDALREAGKHVVIVGPVPQQSFDVPRRLALAAILDQVEPAGVETTVFLGRNRREFRLLDRAAADGASVVLPHRLLCATAHCAVELKGDPLYFDYHHLSLTGARLVAAEVVPYLDLDPGSVATAR